MEGWGGYSSSTPSPTLKNQTEEVVTYSGHSTRPYDIDTQIEGGAQQL